MKVIEWSMVMKTKTKEVTLEEVRHQAVGQTLSEEVLNQFHAGYEEERMISTRHGETRVYIYVPEGERNVYPVMVNLHGGGFVKGYRDQDIVYARNIAQNAGYVVVDVDYHTAPEYRYPYALEESYDVVKYVVEHPAEFWTDLSALVLAGHSAGGNLVCGIQFMAQESGAFQPSCLILEYPPTSFVNRPEDCRYANADYIRISPEQSRKYREWYIDKSHIRDITASPVLATQEELETFPPVLMILAEQDSLSAEGVELAARLLDAGVTVVAKRVKGSCHGFTVHRTNGVEVAEKLTFKMLAEYAHQNSRI